MIGAIGAGHPVAGAGPLGGVNAHVNPGWAHDPAGSRYPSLFSGLIAARLSCFYTNKQWLCLIRPQRLSNRQPRELVIPSNRDVSDRSRRRGPISPTSDVKKAMAGARV